MKPKCAVLLAAYNGMKYIEEQIKTILDQCDVLVTVFVSIDLSSDDTVGWLTRLSVNEPRIVILPYGETFGDAAKNFYRLIRDADFSEFDFVAFADQDDLWKLDKLKRAVAILASGFDAYSSNVTAFWPDGKQVLINKAHPQQNWDYLFEAAGPGCTYVMSQGLMKSLRLCILKHWDLLQNVKAHDWLCYAYARANHYRWYIDPLPSMLYRQHQNNQAGANIGIAAYWKRVKMVLNGWWLSEACLISHIIGCDQNIFVKSWSRGNRLQMLGLARFSSQCRRSKSGQYLFFAACILLAIFGRYKKSENTHNI